MLLKVFTYQWQSEKYQNIFSLFTIQWSYILILSHYHTILILRTCVFTMWPTSQVSNLIKNTFMLFHFVPQNREDRWAGLDEYWKRYSPLDEYWRRYSELDEHWREEDIWAKNGGYHRVRGQESEMKKSENVFFSSKKSLSSKPPPPCPLWLIILSAYWMINCSWWSIIQSWARLWWSSRWRGSVWSVEPPFFKSETHQGQNRSQVHSQHYKPSIITVTQSIMIRWQNVWTKLVRTQLSQKQWSGADMSLVKKKLHHQIFGPETYTAGKNLHNRRSQRSWQILTLVQVYACSKSLSWYICTPFFWV